MITDILTQRLDFQEKVNEIRKEMKTQEDGLVRLSEMIHDLQEMVFDLNDIMRSKNYDRTA
jgi:SPX domain protein involved in polyphosphate accumulation